jgi:hypothetical protein
MKKNSRAAQDTPKAPGAKATAARKGKGKAGRGATAAGPTRFQASGSLGAQAAIRRRAAGKMTNRTAVFRALAKAGAEGLGEGEIRVRIGMSRNNGQLGVILRGEIAGKRVKADERQVEPADVRVGDPWRKVFVTRYTLTDKGKKALEEGTVDGGAREMGLLAKGRAWEHRDK